MRRKYMDYMPNYLDGVNIRRHAEVIDEMTRSPDEKLNLLSLWLSVPRPLIIQRQAISALNIRMTVHVHIREHIKRITVKGDIQSVYEYRDEDMVTDETIHLPFRGSTEYNYYPVLEVTVETYDDITYRKGYPESQTPFLDVYESRGDVYDHDEFLDRIGRMLGVPRRIYKEYQYVDAIRSEPPFTGEKVVDGVVLAYTEDDYYYQERILYYMANFGKISLPELLLRTIYGYTEACGMNAATIEEDPILAEHVEDNSVYIEATETAGSYIFFVNQENPVNIDSLTDEDKTAFTEKYIPITRMAYILPQLLIHLELFENYDFQATTHTFESQLTLDNGEDTPLGGHTVRYTLDGESIERSTDEEGLSVANYPMVGLGAHVLQLDYDGGRGYEGSHQTLTYKSYTDVLVEYDTPREYNLWDFVCDWFLARSGWNHMFHVDMQYSVHRCQFILAGITEDGKAVLLARSMGYGGEHDIMVCSDGTFYVNGATELGTCSENLLSQYDTYAIQVVPIRPNNVPGGSVTISSEWITHFKPYQNDNLLLDEFTLRCNVHVPSGTTTFPVTVGETVSDTTYGFTVELMNFVDADDDYKLEWKFINYIAHFYIDGAYMGVCYDFENNTLIYTNTDPQLTVQDAAHVYSRCPSLLGFQYSDAYYMPSSDHPEYAVPQIRKPSIITMKIHGTVPLYTAQFGEEEIQVDIHIADSRGLPITARVLVKEYGTIPSHSWYFIRHNVDVVDGVGTLTLAGWDVPRTLRLTTETTESWMILPSTGELEIPILTTPLVMNLSIVSPTSVVYCSPTRSVTIRAILDVDPLLGITDTHGRPDLPVTFKDTDTGVVIDTVDTDNAGLAEIHLPIGTQPSMKNITAEWQSSPGETYTGDSKSIQLETVTNVPKVKCTYKGKIAVNKTTPFKVKLTDQYGDVITGTRVAVVDAERSINLAGLIDSNGECTVTIPAQSTPGKFNLSVIVQKTGYTSRYTQFYTMTILDLHVNISSTYSQSINKSDIQNTGVFPFTVSVVEDGEPVTTGKLGVYQVHGGGRTFKKYITVDSASITDSVTINDYDESELVIEFTYLRGNSSILSEYYEIPIINDIISDPFADADFLDKSNWGMFSSSVSGNGLTGTPSTVSSELTVNTSDRTITDTVRNWFIYENATLQDMLTYYSGEFSLVEYKTGGDGRYELGFVNTTTGGYRIAYNSGSVISEQTNSTSSGQEAEYQQWNEFTFKLVGTDLHVYFKRKNNNGYADVTISTANLDLSQYKLYFKSYSKVGLSLTVDTSKIQNHSRET